MPCSAAGVPAGASAARAEFGALKPGNLLVSESVYSNDPNLVAGQTQLPPGCTTGCVTGRVNRDGTVTIWAITSTVSGGCAASASPRDAVGASLARWASWMIS